MKATNKGTMFNALDEMRKAIEPNPFSVTGFEFMEDTGEDIDHRANQIHLGFLQSAKESEEYHKKHPSSEFVYLGDDYLEFIKSQN